VSHAFPRRLSSAAGGGRATREASLAGGPLASGPAASQEWGPGGLAGAVAAAAAAAVDEEEGSGSVHPAARHQQPAQGLAQPPLPPIFSGPEEGRVEPPSPLSAAGFDLPPPIRTGASPVHSRRFYAAAGGAGATATTGTSESAGGTPPPPAAALLAAGGAHPAVEACRCAATYFTRRAAHRASGVGGLSHGGEADAGFEFHLADCALRFDG